MPDKAQRDSLSWRRAGYGLARTDAGEELLRKDFVGEIKQNGINPDTRTVEAVISTGTIDRQGDTVNPNGWELERYMKNPVVLWAHDYRSLPIAKALDVHITGKSETRRLKATAKFETHPFADAVYNLIVSGTINATSVGFKPLEFKYADEDDPDRGFFDLDITKQELLEYSIVPVPANAEALIGAKSLTQEGRNALYDWVAEAVEEGHDTNFDKSDLDRLHQAWSKHAKYVLPGLETVDLAQRNIARLKGEAPVTITNNVVGTVLKVEGSNVTLEPEQVETKPRVGRSGPGSGKSGIQTLIFSKDNWTVAEAKAWARDNDFFDNPVDSEGPSHRIRQFDPELCQAGSFTTLTENMPTGVSMVSCTGKSMTPRKSRKDNHRRLRHLAHVATPINL